MIQINIIPTKIQTLQRVQTKVLNFNKIALIMGLFLFYPHISYGFQEIEINEINYTGNTVWSDDTNTDANDEFIELKNPNPATPMSINGWSLRIVSGAGDRTISLVGDIQDYIVIRKITSAQGSLTPLPKVINITTSQFGSLSNTAGAYIELRNNLGVTVDSVNFMGKWPHITKNGESLHKINNLSWEVKAVSPLNISNSTPPNSEPPIITDPVIPAPIIYGGVMISEIYPNPSEGKKEFVELLNTTDKDIDLAGWKLDDIPNGGSSIQLISGVIPAKGFLVLEDGMGLTIGLNNDADSVILYDPNGNIQSKVDYTMKSSQKGSSYMKVDGIWVWNSEPSPMAINTPPIVVVPEPKPNPIIKPISPQPPLSRYEIGSIILSELYPYPSEGSEFIELVNTTDKDIDITGWKLSDLAKTYILSGMIPAKGYRVWYQDETKISLNNTSDTVTLTDTYNQIQSSIGYTKAKKGLSYISLLQSWSWTTTLTPNAPNIFSEETNDSTKTYRYIDNIETLPEIEDGELLELQAQVIIPPGGLADTSFYIKNNDRIIRVYDRQKRFPILREGDIVRIKSEWHNTDTQQYLKVSAREDISILDNQNIMIRAQDIGTIENNDWGKIVRVNGELDTNTKTKLTLLNKNYTASIKLFSDKVIRPKMKKGDGVVVSGFTEIYDGEIRIIPWDSSQIRVRPVVKVSSVNEVQKASIVTEIRDEISMNSSYQGLDDFQVPGEADLVSSVERMEWYNQLARLVREYSWFSGAIILNSIWWGYLILIKRIKEVK